MGTFGDDNVAKQLPAMPINALDQSKRFIITEAKVKYGKCAPGVSVATFLIFLVRTTSHWSPS